MTKANTKSNATKSTRKANTKSRAIVRTITLKTCHDDIMRENKNATITTKRMRVWLRANMRDVHEHNNAWVFTQNEYDRVRSHFDPKYRAMIERKAKTQSRARPSRKIDTHIDVVDVNAKANA